MNITRTKFDMKLYFKDQNKKYDIFEKTKFFYGNRKQKMVYL